MKRSLVTVIVLFFCVCLFGCAGIDAPTPESVLKNPTGSGSLYVGMMKEEVISLYGEPDSKQTVSSDEWKEPREEWVYRGRYPVLPISPGYLSKDLYLYFDGENLTNISNKSLGTAKKTDSETGYIK